MRCFFDERQLLHAPARELHNGDWTGYAETPARAQAIASALGTLEAPADLGVEPIAAVHAPDYLDFLQRAPGLWAAAGRTGDAIGYVWPIRRRRALRLARIDALLGRYSMDASTPVTAHSWQSSYWSCQAALAATQAALSGEPHAFALCRPPGHHAGRDYLGGYGYLNAAAVAAEHARSQGAGRVAILDIDYHHGNGTQDIFWNRGDVFYASLHADPATDFPFFWGHADERGEGAGMGTTLNLPLPQGTAVDGFRRAQGVALDAIARFAPDLLVVSFGADTWAGDPISRFRLETADYATLAGDIARCGWPTAVVMEGGYAVDALGANLRALLGGFV